MTILDDIGTAAQLLLEHLHHCPPEIAVILGSGLAGNPRAMQVELALPLSGLPGFPQAGVGGHVAGISVGTLCNRRVLFFHGRYHLYEGFSAWQVTAQVRLAAAIGCSKILLTNAAGGIVSSMSPGDFMLVADHLNFTGQHPLIGREERQFLDLCNLYRTDFYPLLRDVLSPFAVRLHSGVLAWMTGPSYETPAEINYLEVAGASAVSMSTIPEAIVARLCGLEVCALSLIANPAAGRGTKMLDHEDVLLVGSRSHDHFHLLLERLLPLWF